jgi:uncharacterized protein YjbI with pentapeptide repeats
MADKQLENPKTNPLDEHELHLRRGEHLTPYGPIQEWESRLMKFSRGFKTTLLDGQKWKWFLGKLWHFTGIPGKTILEIVQILGVAGIAIIIGFFGKSFNTNIQQAAESLKTAFETSKYTHETLEKYIDAITTITATKGLPVSAFENAPEARTLIAHVDPTTLIATAKAKTLTTLFLMQADPTRRDALLYFLREAQLSRRNDRYQLLQGLELPGIDLSEAELTEADLRKTVLVKAKLQGARLAGANLTGSRLERADLSEAALTKADLSGAIAPYANFKKATLRGATLQGINLEQANLEGADLTRTLPPHPLETDLSNSQLRGASLEGAKLQQANLTGAKLGLPEIELSKEEQRNFRFYTNLKNANLEGADLTDADLTGADLTGADLKSANLTGAKLAELKDSAKADLTGADLGGATYEPEILNNAILCNTHMTGGGVSNRDCWWNKILNVVNLGESSSLRK